MVGMVDKSVTDGTSHPRHTMSISANVELFMIVLTVTDGTSRPVADGTSHQ